MAKINQNIEHDILEEGNEKLTHAFTDAEFYFEQYKNIIIYSIAVVAIGIAGWWGYNNLIRTEKKAKMHYILPNNILILTR